MTTTTTMRNEKWNKRLSINYYSLIFFWCFFFFLLPNSKLQFCVCLLIFYCCYYYDYFFFCFFTSFEFFSSKHTLIRYLVKWILNFFFACVSLSVVCCVEKVLFFKIPCLSISLYVESNVNDLFIACCCFHMVKMGEWLVWWWWWLCMCCDVNKHQCIYVLLPKGK